MDKKLVEKVAKKLCELDGWIWDGLDKKHNICISITQSDYLKKAEEVIPIIAEEIKKELEDLRYFGEEDLYIKFGKYDWGTFWEKYR